MKYIVIKAETNDNQTLIKKAEKIEIDVKEKLDSYGEEIYNTEYKEIKSFASKKLEEIWKEYARKMYQKYLAVVDVDTKDKSAVKKYDIDLNDFFVKQALEHSNDGILQDVYDIVTSPNIKTWNKLNYHFMSSNFGSSALKDLQSIKPKNSEERKDKEDGIKLVEIIKRIFDYIKNITPIKGRRPKVGTIQRPKIDNTQVEKPDSIAEVPEDENAIVALIKQTQASIQSLKKEYKKQKEGQKRKRIQLEIENLEKENKYYRALLVQQRNARNLLKDMTLEELKDKLAPVKEFIDKWGEYTYNSLERDLDSLVEEYNNYLKKSNNSTVNDHQLYREFKKAIADNGAVSFASYYIYNDLKINKEAVIKNISNWIEKEKDVIYLNMYQEVYKYTGKITGARDMSMTVDKRGYALNGYITGEKGNVKIQTIMAGGYNIQRLHVRTLVRPVDFIPSSNNNRTDEKPFQQNSNLDLKKGDRIAIEYDENIFLGTISRVGKDKYYFVFDDGDVGNAHKNSKRILGRVGNRKIKRALTKTEYKKYLV